MKKKLNSIEYNYIEKSQDGAIWLAGEISKEISSSVGKSSLLLVSGGSALDVLNNIKNESFAGVTLAVLDERFDEANENNNFSQIEKLPWSNGFLQNGGSFILTKVLPGDTQDILAQRFQIEIEKWISKNVGGRIVALFGMGADGHTAGIFPYPENSKLFKKLFDGDALVVSYFATGKNKFEKRITTTNSIFGKIKIGFLYVYGQEKASALHDFMKSEKNPNELPIMFLKGIEKIKLVTDIK